MREVIKINQHIREFIDEQQEYLHIYQQLYCKLCELVQAGELTDSTVVNEVKTAQRKLKELKQ